MKKLITTTLLVLFFGYVYAQKDVTTFLGIPVDGTRSEMVKKLKEKGFTTKSNTDLLQGRFNGRDSYVSIQTNRNGKVWRIGVMDVNPMSEISIKIRFNNLVTQFSQKEDKYIGTGDSQIIPEDEDISYEMLVHSKRYEALFYQMPNFELFDKEYAQQRIYKVLSQKYTAEQIQNPTEKEKAEIDEIISEETQTINYETARSKAVWFMINEKYGEYSIFMYYENRSNNIDDDDL